MNNRIKELREARGMSLADVAKMITRDGAPVSRAAISRLENGSRKLSVEWAKELANIFRCSVEDVYGTSESMEMDYVELREEIEKRGLNRSELAEALGKSRQIVTYILEGSRKIRADEIPVIREWLQGAQPKERTLSAPANKNGRQVPVFSLSKTEDGFVRSGLAVRHLDGSNPLSGVRGGFAEIYPLTTDMTPKFEPGEVILVDPNQVPRTNDYVRVEFVKGGVVYRRFAGVEAGGFKLESLVNGVTQIKEESVKSIGTVIGTLAG